MAPGIGLVQAGEGVVVAFRPGLVCARYPLVLPDFRVEFHAARETWELGRLEDVHKRLSPGMTVLDIGAESGDFTALYRSWGASVVPVEPVPQYWPCIRRTFEANGFEPPPAWILGFAGDTTVYRDGDNGCDSWPPCSDGPVVADYGFLHLAHNDTASRWRIDSMPTPMPDALMIDVEGAEWHALSGAEELLTSRPTLVWMSLHPVPLWEWYGKTPEDITDLMKSFGYVGTELPHYGEGEKFFRFESGRG